MAEANGKRKQADFMAGRDLACALLNRAKEFEGTDHAELSIQYREGAAQVEFVTPFLDQLCAHPELRSGFAAALSCVLSAGCIDSSGLSELTYQQIFGPYRWPDDEPVSNVLPFKRVAHGEVHHG